ncbi:hypothetical protein PsAD2_04141 [Pseudovibrio axinellae]|uniref:Uncharacterized protein n=1 Tax=Pseudovibrio axinellae TaxID=989403 RepID=A0A165TYI8_9HYPH|nr:hypothetical protein PsAD2_04141 [Pseudovibrio axinellae]SEP75148.1 hypothetical protein SAMN05421798_101307 [Pseudovibrio axinellae]
MNVPYWGLYLEAGYVLLRFGINKPICTSKSDRLVQETKW